MFCFIDRYSTHSIPYQIYLIDGCVSSMVAIIYLFILFYILDTGYVGNH